MDNCDIEGIRANFPQKAKLPKKCTELAQWLDLNIDTTQDYFPEIQADDLEGWADIDISPYFGTFMHLGDGSVVAYWFYDGVDIKNPPIVVITSDGDIGVAANSIEEFLARIIEDCFPDDIWVDYLGDLLSYADGTWIEDLRKWVEEKWSLNSGKREELTSANPELGHPDIQEWIKPFIDQPTYF
ncbi:MAG: hypothetical protein AAGA80_02685 [Cyanobacteria bacterium P01_F01_bin.143]